MKILLFTLSVFLFFSCSDKNSDEHKEKKRQKVSLYFNYTENSFLGFQFKIKNITLVPYDGERIAVTPQTFDLSIQTVGNRVKLSDIDLPHGDYAGVIFDVDLTDTVIQVPYFTSWREVNLLTVNLNHKGDVNAELPAPLLKIRVAEPFSISGKGDVNLQINLNTPKAFPSIGLSETSSMMTFVPAFELEAIGETAVLEGISNNAFKAKEKILEDIDSATSNAEYIVTFLSDTSFTAKRLDEVKVIEFSDKHLVTEDDKPLSFQDLLLGQRVYFTADNIVAKTVSLTVRVLSRDTATQQLSVEPVMINKLAPLAMMSDGHRTAIQTVQLKRRSGAPYVPDASLGNEEMSALFLSPEPPEDLLVTFNGYLRAEKGFFESYFVRIDDLFGLELLISADEGLALAFKRDEGSALYDLDAQAAGKKAVPVIKVKDKAIILQGDIQRVRLNDDVRLTLQEVSSTEYTVVHVSSIKAVVAVIGELMDGGASITRIIGTGELTGNVFTVNHLEVVHSKPIVDKEGDVVDANVDKAGDVVDAKINKAVEPEPEGLSSGDVVSISVASGAATFIAAALVIKCIVNLRKRTHPTPSSGANRSREEPIILHPVVEQIVDNHKNQNVLLTAEDNSVYTETTKILSEAVFKLEDDLSLTPPHEMLRDIIDENTVDLIKGANTDEPIYDTPADEPIYAIPDVGFEDDDYYDLDGEWEKQEDGRVLWINEFDDEDSHTHGKTIDEIIALQNNDPSNREIAEIIGAHARVESESNRLNDYSEPFEPNEGKPVRVETSQNSEAARKVNERFRSIVRKVIEINKVAKDHKTNPRFIEVEQFYPQLKALQNKNVTADTAIYANLPSLKVLSTPVQQANQMQTDPVRRKSISTGK